MRCTCSICQEHAGQCYYVTKRKSGLFIDKASSSNGFRTKLSESEWRLLGVDLSWPPEPEPGVWKPEAFFALGEPWSDQREASELAKELQWLTRIGAEDLE